MEDTGGRPPGEVEDVSWREMRFSLCVPWALSQKTWVLVHTVVSVLSQVTFSLVSLYSCE